MADSPNPYLRTPPSSGPWIIAGAIILAAVLIVGALVYFRSQDSESRCAELRAEMSTTDDVLGHIEKMQANGCYDD